MQFIDVTLRFIVDQTSRIVNSCPKRPITGERQGVNPLSAFLSVDEAENVNRKGFRHFSLRHCVRRFFQAKALRRKEDVGIPQE